VPPVGRVYFTADSLIDAQRVARQNGEDTPLHPS
jgi:hypothetical protein